MLVRRHELYPHFTQVMGLQSLEVTVTYLEPISVKQFPDRTALAEAAYNQITKHYFANRDPSFKPWLFGKPTKPGS